MGKSSKGREQFYRYSNKTHTTVGHAQAVVGDVGICSIHRKRCYATRKLAKQVCKIMKKTGDHPVEPYLCDQGTGFWHVGGKLRKNQDPPASVA